MNVKEFDTRKTIFAYLTDLKDIQKIMKTTDELLNWAIGQWNSEVKYRPLQNVHRRNLDDTWRSVIRYLGGDDVALLGKRHDDLIKEKPYKSKKIQPELAVWYGSMPESNGKTNWTAILYRKDEGIMRGTTIDCSEYPDRVRYEADRIRYLIGDLDETPFIIDYDSDKCEPLRTKNEI